MHNQSSFARSRVLLAASLAATGVLANCRADVLIGVEPPPSAKPSAVDSDAAGAVPTEPDVGSPTADTPVASSGGAGGDWAANSGGAGGVPGSESSGTGGWPIVVSSEARDAAMGGSSGTGGGFAGSSGSDTTLATATHLRIDALPAVAVNGPSLRLVAGGLGGYGTVDGIGTAARFTAPEGVASDGAGNLFVANSGDCTIRKIVIATGAVTTFAGAPSQYGSDDGIGASARFYSPRGLASDGAGNLFVADYGNRTIRKIVIATGAVTTFAGSPDQGGSDDGIGTAARFFAPWHLAYDGAGNLLVSDYSQHTIRKIVIATGAVTTLAGSPGQAGSNDGTGAAARFGGPWGVASDRTGNLFVADSSNCTIRKIVVATGAVTTLAGSPGYQGSADGQGSDARFFGPAGLTYDGSGNLFVAELASNSIRKVVIATGTVTTLAVSWAEKGSDDGTGAEARLNWPADVTNDGAGNLFVADSSNDTIRKVVIATGAITTLAGSPAKLGSSDGTATEARFYYPSQLVNDGAGNLLVADNSPSVLRKVDPSTGVVTTLAFPSGHLATDGLGNLFVAKSTSDAILKVRIATGGFSTIAAISACSLASDGVDSLFLADCHQGTIDKVSVSTGVVTSLADASQTEVELASDGAGGLFVADTYNNKVLKVDGITGKTTLLAGSGDFGSKDGIGSAAQFVYPTAMAYDRAGSLFVVDSHNRTIRKIVIATGAVSTVVGVPGIAGVVLGPLPAGLNDPSGLVVGPSGELFILDENSVLVAHF